jgi:REP element-mobilizing transposase RayT
VVTGFQPVSLCQTPNSFGGKEEEVVRMSFWRTYYHLIWSTKNREPLITPQIEPRVYAYIVNKAAELEVFVFEINGCPDHIHLVATIPPKHSVAEVVKHLKGASSYDINQQHMMESPFAWQRGYGVLTLGSRQRAEAEAYVRAQKQHHRENTENPWLEREGEIDEGPPDYASFTKNQVPAIREDRVVYASPEDLPW